MDIVFFNRVRDVCSVLQAKTSTTTYRESFHVIAGRSQERSATPRQLIIRLASSASASHALAIDGNPHSGWCSVESGKPGSKLMEFTFSIQDDGNGNYLLVYSSLDGVFSADTWHETIDEAVAVAESEFGIERTEWGRYLIMLAPTEF